MPTIGTTSPKAGRSASAVRPENKLLTTQLYLKLLAAKVHLNGLCMFFVPLRLKPQHPLAKAELEAKLQADRQERTDKRRTLREVVIVYPDAGPEGLENEARVTVEVAKD